METETEMEMQMCLGRGTGLWGRPSRWKLHFWEGAQDKQTPVPDTTVLVGAFYLCTVGIPINLRVNILCNKLERCMQFL